jgi:hypothetical protein
MIMGSGVSRTCRLHPEINVAFGINGDSMFG